MENRQTLPSSPCYVLEEEKLRRNLTLIRRVAEEAGVEIILAFKAYALWKTFPIFREYIHSCTASSIYEAEMGYTEMGCKVHTFTPALTSQNIEAFRRWSSHISFNSFSQEAAFGASTCADHSGVSYGIRVNPEYSPVETDLYNPSMPGSRFGVTIDEIRQRGGLPQGVEGVHVHALCESNSFHLENLLQKLSQSIPDILQSIRWINLGGGHLMTHKDYRVEHLIETLRSFRAVYPNLKVILEPGSAFAWQTGYLKSKIVDIVEHHSIQTAILDVSFTCHMPDCLEMPYQPTVRGALEEVDRSRPTYRLGGCSCLSGDYIGDWSFEKPLEIGQEIILEDMLHYTTVKTNMFNGIHHPGIVLHRLDGTFSTLREYTYQDYKERMD